MLAAFAAVSALVSGIIWTDSPTHGCHTWERRRRSGMPGHTRDGVPHLHATERARRARQSATVAANAARRADPCNGRAAFTVGLLRGYGQIVCQEPSYYTALPRKLSGRARARARRAFARRWRAWQG